RRRRAAAAAGGAGHRQRPRRHGRGGGLSTADGRGGRDPFCQDRFVRSGPARAAGGGMSTNTAPGTALKNVTAVLSMVHEPPDPQPNSATRRFRGAPVLQWTLDRTHRAARIDTVAVICWEDQLPAVLP